MGRSASYVYVLTALRGGPLHGLGIAEVVSAFTEETVVLGPGTLYRCLSDLTEDGLIRRVAAPEDEESSGRKYYELTTSGRAELADALRELEMVLEAARRRGAGPAGAVT